MTGRAHQGINHNSSVLIHFIFFVISSAISGGEGCILSAAASPMGIGADVGGSIRMPAFFNGIFGHKPSTGCYHLCFLLSWAP